MTQVIAILALCASVLLLVVHYINQLERRHAEIVQLRSDFLFRLSMAHQRLTSNILHAESVRMALRTMRDSDEKYEAIELMPQLVETAKQAAEEVKVLISGIEAIDTKKINRSEALLALQSASHDVRSLEQRSSNMENDMLAMVEIVRSRQSTEESNPEE